MSMSKREKILIVIVLVLAVVCVYYIYFLRPNINTMNELFVQRVNKESMLNNQKIGQQEVVELDKQIKALEEEIAGYDNNISKGFDQPEILVYLENTINTNGKKMMFSFSDIQHIGRMDICPVTVTMSATYDGLKQVLDEFSSGKHIIKVTSLNAAQLGVSPSSQSENIADIINEELDIENMLDSNSGSTVQSPPSDSSGNKELQITLTLEVYTMSGEIAQSKTYPFDNKDYNYGGDIFY